MSYETFTKMNVLWLQYIQTLLGNTSAPIDLKDCSIQTSICGKLSKADFSGAKLTVIKSRN